MVREEFRFFVGAAVFRLRPAKRVNEVDDHA
jgi:hypothetical protein